MCAIIVKITIDVPAPPTGCSVRAVAAHHGKFRRKALPTGNDIIVPPGLVLLVGEKVAPSDGFLGVRENVLCQTRHTPAVAADRPAGVRPVVFHSAIDGTSGGCVIKFLAPNVAWHRVAWYG